MHCHPRANGDPGLDSRLHGNDSWEVTWSHYNFLTPPEWGSFLAIIPKELFLQFLGEILRIIQE
jgi:hypothetical protein